MRLLLAVLIVAIVTGIFGLVAPRADAQTVQFQQQAKAGQATAPTDLAAALAERPESRLGFLQRRKLGLTWRNLRPIVKHLQEEGRIGNGNPSADAVLVMEELMAQNPEAWAAEAPTVDWDAIIEFLERLIPLILKILSLFGL